MTPRSLIILTSLVIGLLMSWWMIRDIEGSDAPEAETESSIQLPSANAVPIKSSRKKEVRSERTVDPATVGAIPNERIVQFKDRKSYEDFLAKLRNSKAKNLGSIDSLWAVRVGFGSRADFDALGLDEDDVAYNYSFRTPDLPSVGAQPGAVGFGGSALPFLGIREDNSTWGQDVTIAVIDSAIQSHLTLENVRHISLLELPEGASPHPHGTAVASLIAGRDPRLLGVAPAADLISIPVVDEAGNSNSFLIAQAIAAAEAAGADIVNLSLGGGQRSFLVEQALQSLEAAGGLAVISSGNNGLDTAAYPSSSDHAISVGAVDARGDYLNFSNRDADLSISAPGLQINAAVNGESVFSFSGTSASAPLVSGAVAAIMSESPTPISPQDAMQILIDYSNEAGAGGIDPNFGNGILNVGRAMNRNEPGISDLAVASYHFLDPGQSGASPGVQINVENRGTEVVTNATVSVGVDDGVFNLGVGVMEPNERRALVIPTSFNPALGGELQVRSQLNLPPGTVDTNSRNDTRQDTLSAGTDAE